MNRPYIIFIGILTASLAVSAVLSLPPRAAGTSPSGNVTLRLGSKNVAVSVLQKNLIEKGYLTINAPTGYFGPLTAAAMKAFQKASGLPQTGAADPATFKAMNGKKQ